MRGGLVDGKPTHSNEALTLPYFALPDLLELLPAASFALLTFAWAEPVALPPSILRGCTLLLSVAALQFQSFQCDRCSCSIACLCTRSKGSKISNNSPKYDGLRAALLPRNEIIQPVPGLIEPVKRWEGLKYT